MAIPQGGFNGTGPSTGAYSYTTGTVLPMYYAGTFFIDTGYDDPGSWAAGLEAAEIYGARVYGASGVHSPTVGAGNPTGKWNVNSTPVWSSQFYETPHSNPYGLQRVLIKCECWVSDPASTATGAYHRLDTCDWTLYRL